MNRTQLGLWSAIAGVFLLAILGIRSAANWLAQSSPSNPEDQALTITGNQTDGAQSDIERIGGDGGGLSTRTEDRIVTDRDSDRINAQTNQQTDTSQPGDTLTFSPLEEAGTYIQRQKSVERDSFVAATQVEAVPVANNSTDTQAQNDSRVTQPAPETVSNTQPSQERPATPAVPAHW